MKTHEYKIRDCNYNAPEHMRELDFEKSINELAKDRWEPLFPFTKYRIPLVRTIKEDE